MIVFLLKKVKSFGLKLMLYSRMGFLILGYILKDNFNTFLIVIAEQVHNVTAVKDISQTEGEKFD